MWKEGYTRLKTECVTEKDFFGYGFVELHFISKRLAELFESVKIVE